MTLPDPSLDRQAAGPDNIQDRVPLTERGEDPERDAMEHALTVGEARPLTSEEKEAAEHDTPVAERVYAPASERVPKEPVPGHRDMVEHTDTHTPEREATEPADADGGGTVGEMTEEDAPHGGSIASDAPGAYPSGSAGPSGSASASAGANSTGASEPTFARVPRPGSGASVDTPTPSPYASSATNPGYVMPESWQSPPSRPWWMPAAWLMAPILVAVGVFLYLRWQRERNKPLNRIRRHAGRARKAAGDLRERVPSPTEAKQPTMGLLAALVSTAILLWRRMQADTSANPVTRARDTVSETDWQERLSKLKERWSPKRLELEKVSISKR